MVQLFSGVSYTLPKIMYHTVDNTPNREQGPKDKNAK